MKILKRIVVFSAIALFAYLFVEVVLVLVSSDDVRVDYNPYSRPPEFHAPRGSGSSTGDTLVDAGLEPVRVAEVDAGASTIPLRWLTPAESTHQSVEIRFTSAHSAEEARVLLGQTKASELIVPLEGRSGTLEVIASGNVYFVFRKIAVDTSNGATTLIVEDGTGNLRPVESLPVAYLIPVDVEVVQETGRTSSPPPGLAVTLRCRPAPRIGAALRRQYGVIEHVTHVLVDTIPKKISHVMVPAWTLMAVVESGDDEGASSSLGVYYFSHRNKIASAGDLLRVELRALTTLTINIHDDSRTGVIEALNGDDQGETGSRIGARSGGSGGTVGITLSIASLDNGRILTTLPVAHKVKRSELQEGPGVVISFTQRLFIESNNGGYLIWATSERKRDVLLGVGEVRPTESQDAVVAELYFPSGRSNEVALQTLATDGSVVQYHELVYEYLYVVGSVAVPLSSGRCVTDSNGMGKVAAGPAGSSIQLQFRSAPTFPLLAESRGGWMRIDLQSVSGAVVPVTVQLDRDSPLKLRICDASIDARPNVVSYLILPVTGGTGESDFNIGSVVKHDIVFTRISVPGRYHVFLRWDDVYLYELVDFGGTHGSVHDLRVGALEELLVTTDGALMLAPFDVSALTLWSMSNVQRTELQQLFPRLFVSKTANKFRVRATQGRSWRYCVDSQLTIVEVNCRAGSGSPVPVHVEKVSGAGNGALSINVDGNVLATVETKARKASLVLTAVYSDAEGSVKLGLGLGRVARIADNKASFPSLPPGTYCLAVILEEDGKQTVYADSKWLVIVEVVEGKVATLSLPAE